jgi:hypothetical protein
MSGTVYCVKDWEIIADNLSKAGWSWGCVSAVDFHGRTIWIALVLVSLDHSGPWALF